MSVCTEAYDLVHEIAGEPARPIKTALDRAKARIAPYLEMSLSRVENIWRREARLIRAEEMDALRAAAAARRRKVEAGRAAAAELADLYQGVAARLRQVDEDFHRPEIARLERSARALSPVDRAGAAPNSVATAAPRDGGQT